MNENANGTSRSTGRSAAVGFLIGATLGAGIALLLAPRSGKQSRRRIAEAGGRLGNAARSQFGKARDLGNDLKRDVASAVQAGRDHRENRRDRS